MKKFYQLNQETIKQIKKLKGPILIFGVGGFIGFNLYKSLSLYRSDVYGVSRDPDKNWRFYYSQTPLKNIYQADLSQSNEVSQLINKLKPQTIFNLAAYGAYSRQKNYRQIYETNLKGLVSLLEVLKKHKFAALVKTGSSSEYGLNCSAPKEDQELLPNSHYAVSKVAGYYAIKYYGLVEQLPVAHVRLYAVYGPWEEPDRLVPNILARGLEGKYPKLVHPEISRDFIYISDVISALVMLAIKMKLKIYGETFNVGTGTKTTIKDLILKTQKICQVKKAPSFGQMPKRDWDMVDWYADISKIKSVLHWQPNVSIINGLKKTMAWQQASNYKNIEKNWKKKYA